MQLYAVCLFDIFQNLTHFRELKGESLFKGGGLFKTGNYLIILYLGYTFIRGSAYLKGCLIEALPYYNNIVGSFDSETRRV